MEPQRLKFFDHAFRVVHDFDFKEVNTIVARDNKPSEPNGQLERVDGKGFRLLFPMDLFENMDLGTSWSISLEVAGHTVHTSSAIMVARGVNATKKQSISGVTLNIGEFHTSEASATIQFYRRVLIPIGPKAFDSIHHQLQLTSYEAKPHWVMGRVPISLKRGDFDLIIHHHGEEHFVVLDALQTCTLDELLHVSHDIALTLGYVTGELAQAECFCFAYASPMMDEWQHFSYHTLRDSIRSSYAPVHANPYGYLNDDLSEAERIHGLLRPISIGEFNSLCERVMSDDAFASHLLLIQESMAASLIAMPPGLCVALEGLCRIATARAKKEAELIEHKAGKKKNVAEELLISFLSAATALLEEMWTEENKEAVKSLRKKLDNIGQPTNRAQLEAPFEALGFKLNEEDIKAINSRNRFLHGDVMLKKKNSDEANREAFYMALRLYCLLAVLILKPTGYDNRITNYPRIHARIYGLRMEEEYFRPIELDS